MGCSDSKQENSKDNAKKSKLVMRDSKKSEIKVVFLGDAGVGKSSIAQRYCYNKFVDTYEVTIGGVYHRKDVQLSNGQQMVLHLWDTGGEERFKAMAPLYYRDANVAILVYDVKEKKSFEGINFWLKELNDKVRQDGLVLGLAGNKCDVEDNLRKVQKSEAQKFAHENNLIFYETSALTDEGIGLLFQELCEAYYKKKTSQTNGKQ